MQGGCTFSKQPVDLLSIGVRVELHSEAQLAQDSVEPLGVPFGSIPLPQIHTGVKGLHRHDQGPVSAARHRCLREVQIYDRENLAKGLVPGHKKPETES